jgi:hypothetical protein
MSDASGTEEPRSQRPRRRAEALDERDGLRPVDGPAAGPSEAARGREPRLEEERRERRARLDTLDGDYRYNLIVTVPQDHATFAYCWELDEPGRLQFLEARDWDRTPGQAPIHAYNDGLTPVHYVLMQKFRDWHEDDERRRATRERAHLDEIRRSKPAEDFGKTPDGRSAQYTRNARGEDIGVSIETRNTPR